MTLPASGAISFGQVDTELGLGATTSISLNQTNVRTLFGVASGAISMSNGQGKTNGGGSTVTLTVTSNITNLNVYNAATGTVPSGVTRSGTYSATSTVNVIVNAGVVVGSSNPSTYAFDTGTGWQAGNTLTLTNNGYIVGMGGQGGNGAVTYSTGYVGIPGGPSMHLQKAISITNGSGYIYSGGGGGSTGWTDGSVATLIGGGGGGAGFNPGPAGWQGPAGGGMGLAGNLTHGGQGGATSIAIGGGYAGGALNYAGLGGPENGARRGGGGGGGGASGGTGIGGIKAGHGLAITGISFVTWVSGNTRVYGGTA